LAKLRQLASIVRSKNAEPYLTTMDIYFPSSQEYEEVRTSNALAPERIAEAYKIPADAVYGVYFVDAVHAAKVTLFKYNGGYRGQGDPDVGDVFGAQQYVPLLEIEIDEETR